MPTRPASVLPPQVAVLNNHEELVQLLLDKGADVSVKNEVSGWGALPPERPPEERAHVGNAVSLFLFQFGKGVLEMARVFDRQVGCSFRRLPRLCAYTRGPRITSPCCCWSRTSSPCWRKGRSSRCQRSRLSVPSTDPGAALLRGPGAESRARPRLSEASLRAAPLSVYSVEGSP